MLKQWLSINLLNPTAYIHELYALPPLYLYVVYLSQNKQRLVSHHKLIGFHNREEKCLQRGTEWVFK